MKIFIVFLIQGSRMTFFNGIQFNGIQFNGIQFNGIQFKCKECKDNNICYENVHHISVP